MRLLLIILVFLALLNAAGGYAMPAYAGWGYYPVSWGGIVLLVVILYLLGVGRGGRTRL